MKNNNIGTVAVAASKRDNTLKNKSSDLHTTMDFGSVMPGKVQRMIAGSSFNTSTKMRLLLTSLVRPCFGRIMLQEYHNFVPFSDITQNYAPLMAQQAVARGNGKITPQELPSVESRWLSLFILTGAQVTVYRGAAGGRDVDTLYLDKIPQLSQAWNISQNALPQNCQTAFSDLGISTHSFTELGLQNSYGFDFFKLFTGETSYVTIPVSNPTPASFFDCLSNNPDVIEYDDSVPVDLDSADVVIPISVNGNFYTLAFRLSSFGRRLRKNLIGCGWQFNLNTEKRISILPLIAYYKSYFDVFGLTLYNNWEQTHAYQVMQMCDLEPVPRIPLESRQSVSAVAHEFRQFLYKELGMTFFTEEQDFVSSHTRTNAVSPRQDGLISQIDTDVAGTPNITLASSSSEPTDLSSPNSHAYINNVTHGQLDSELLKRLYRQTNINTVAGRRIAELLRAQGLGAYVDECKTNFIGKNVLEVPIYDLPAQSDTFNKATGDGAHTGEFGAFGKGSQANKPMHYETSEDGYYISLLVIVPKGGYAEAFDPDILAIDKYQQYNPEYDSLGMEYDEKLLVQGSQPWMSQYPQSEGSLDQSFGVAPRYFKFKFGRNVINGDFSLRSTRAGYAPFHLEKMLLVGECKVEVGTVTTSDEQTAFVVTPEFDPCDMPIAGDVWRYLTRYEWLARFNRIFYNSGSSFSNLSALSDIRTAQFEYFSLRDDNFIVHEIYDLQVYDKMLPVQDSFETTDDAHHANGAMSKA